VSARARRRSPARPVSRVLVVVAAFLLGLAVGLAVDDGAEPGLTTYERTLRFATVTVQAP
jgi:hypothetical protein